MISIRTAREAWAEIAAACVRILALWEPPADITVSQWAERNRYMPRGTTSRPGQWKNEVFQREPQDVFCDPEVHEIVLMKCTQIGWSEILNNIIGFVIDNDPQPMMLIQPTVDNAKDYGRKRISPMIANCPALEGKVKPAQTRAGGNTLLGKDFPNGYLKMVGANTGTGLRSNPLPIVLADEIDGYPDDVNGEGDPIEIARRRTDGYANYKFLMGSTPGKPKGVSRIELEWERSDKRRFNVHCPFCNHLQPLEWRDKKTGNYRLVYKKDDRGEVIRSSVAYQCAGCAKEIHERYKQQMLDGGHWVAEQPGRAVVGFHINALYSPWKENWPALAQEWVDAQENKEKLRAFINLRLGETFVEDGNAMDAEGLLAPGRREAYATEVPVGVGVLTLSVDVQDNRLEAKVKGWGAGEESWLVAHEVFWGDPSAAGADVVDSVWHQLEQLRLKPFKAPGRPLHIAITVVDSGGHCTDAVYDYVTPRQGLRDRVFAIKGVEYHTKPVLVQEGTTKRGTVKLYTIATYAAKDRIFSRLKFASPEAGKPKPGFLHFPDWTTEEYFAQLTGERKSSVRDKRTRTKKYIWVQTHTHNEALDLEVYALGALFILQGYLHRSRDLAAAAAEALLPLAPAAAAAKATKPPGWVGDWGSKW